MNLPNRSGGFLPPSIYSIIGARPSALPPIGVVVAATVNISTTVCAASDVLTGTFSPRALIESWQCSPDEGASIAMHDEIGRHGGPPGMPIGEPGFVGLQPITQLFHPGGAPIPGGLQASCPPLPPAGQSLFWQLLLAAHVPSIWARAMPLPQPGRVGSAVVPAPTGSAGRSPMRCTDGVWMPMRAAAEAAIDGQFTEIGSRPVDCGVVPPLSDCMPAGF